MSACSDLQEMLPRYVEGDLEAGATEQVRAHLTTCEECSEIATALQIIADAVKPIRELEPPPYLESDLASSPCRRWLGLLFQAVDREIGEINLQRLLAHMEGCEACRRAWNDLSLIHQVGDAMEPPPDLLHSCVRARRRPARRPILSKRVATAAAYVLAVLTSLIAGNPVILARNPATDTVQRVATTITQQVTVVAEEGRGEARVMLWRAWEWGTAKTEAVRAYVSELLTDDDAPADEAGSEQGEST